MMNRYKQLLTYIRSAVTRNYSEKSINSILDYISTSKQVWDENKVSLQFPLLHVLNRFLCGLCKQMDLLQEFYETTLEALKDAKNDRLWFKTNTKVCKAFSSAHSSLMFFFVRQQLVLFWFCFFPVVGEVVFGKRRIWKTAEDSEATSPVMSGE